MVGGLMVRRAVALQITRDRLVEAVLPALPLFTSRFFASSAPALDKPAKMTDLNSRDHFVRAADEGRTIVCYHPQGDFPYEHSLPVPRAESLLNGEESLLKAQFRQNWIDESDSKNKEPDIVHLGRIFARDKVHFRPQPQIERKRRNVIKSVERDGL
ncbi:hypothetical protein BV898_00083 [Hypsibius exemplaris]|uniref:Large ribosomal subunit protein mL42 n=1 Tax=Hypsibius exemplaris TaxID=2072580 RepID=A0A1W0XF09_HYPEX|nr:hypothetical protein BV898_00083 [Hypsibius exemplaris]